MLRAVARGAGWCLLCAAALLLPSRRRLEADATCVPRRVLFADVRAELFFRLEVLFFFAEEVFFAVVLCAVLE